MQAISFKLGHIFVPLLVLAVGFVAIYSAANYGLVIATGWLPLDRNLANGWLPGALGLILTFVLIAPRVNVLTTGKKGRDLFLYQMFAAAVVAAPTVFAQYYLTAETGRLIHVEKAEMIASVPRGEYYTAGSVCVDRNNPVVTERNELSGRSNQYLDFKLYVLTPVCGPAAGRAWIALTFTDQIDSNASDEAKQAKYKAFAQHAQEQFDAFDFGRAQYFEALGRTTDRRIYEKALSEHGVSQVAPVILIPHDEAFENRAGDTLNWAIWSFGVGAVVFLLLILVRGLDPEKVEAARLPRPARKADEDGFAKLFIPRRDAYGLPVLLDLNLAVYVAMVFSGLGVMSFQTDDLRAWGGIYGPAMHGMGTYRLVTSQFVHGGVMHLASNMYGLLFGGMLLSPVLRKFGLILCYLACGLAGGLASMFFHPTITTVGASGAIMGLFGILVVLAALGDKRVAGLRTAILTNCTIFAGLTLGQGFLIPGIDNSAHIAGFAAGAALGLPIFTLSWGERLEHRAEDKAA